MLNSPIVADPLRLLDICATSDGAAALIVARAWTFARTAPRHRSTACRGSRRSRTVTPTLPADGARAARLRHRLERGRRRRPTAAFKDSIAWRGLRGGRASAPTTSAWPRSTTSPPRSSSTGTRTSGCAARARPRRCCARARPTLGGRIPVNPRGGLACFGEAIPAQAIAQVCEVTWQLRGQAGDRQVEGARVGITANQGLFGHGSSVIVSTLSGSGSRPSGDVETHRHGRGLHRRSGPHARRAARRRPVAGPPRRPRRALDQGA